MRSRARAKSSVCRSLVDDHALGSLQLDVADETRHPLQVCWLVSPELMRPGRNANEFDLGLEDPAGNAEGVSSCDLSHFPRAAGELNDRSHVPCSSLLTGAARR